MIDIDYKLYIILVVIVLFFLVIENWEVDLVFMFVRCVFILFVEFFFGVCLCCICILVCVVLVCGIRFYGY